MARTKSSDTPQDAPVDPDDYVQIDERWFVEEYYPPRIDFVTGFILPEAWIRNSIDLFVNEAGINSWIAQHEPDFEGGKFRKAHEVLREVTVQQWFPA